MAEITIDEIVEKIREQNPQFGSSEPTKPRLSLFDPASSFLPSIGSSEPVGGPQKLELARYDVDPRAIYDRKRDGSYVAKFDNYIGQEGNEDRLAQQQSGGEQLLKGLTKNAIKMGNYALDATVGTVWGVIQGLESGSFNQVWDNDFSNKMDDWNKSLDYALPNYYTDEQKSMNFIQSLGTANFYANDLAGGLAFVGGAILPEIALAAVSGGSTLPTSLAKLGLKAAFKSGAKIAAKESAEAMAKKGLGILAKQGPAKIDNLLKYQTAEKAMELINAGRIAKLGETSGNILSTGRFLLTTSNFEAGMEARHNFHDSMDEFMMSFEEKNGRAPTYDEISDFTRDAVSAGNMLYTANMAILIPSNAVMFASKFNIGLQTGKKFRNAGNRLIGLGVKKEAGKDVVFAGATRAQKLLGNSYFILGKPAVEGLYEEGLQGVAGTTMQNYLNAKYDPEVESGYGAWASFTDAFAHQYSSKEGWKEMGLGMIIGSMGGTFQGEGFAGLTKKNSRRARQKKLEGEINIVNEAQANLNARINNATSLTNYGNLIKSKADKYQSTDIENAQMNVQYIQGQEVLKSQSEITKNFEAVVDNMQLTESQIEEVGAENVDAYKTALKEEFSQNMADYKFASKLVKAIGLDRDEKFDKLAKKVGKGKAIKITKGNRAEIGQAMIMNIVGGKSALSSARNIASQIDTLTGTDGIFSYLEHFNGLSQEKKNRIKEIKTKRRDLESLRQKAIVAANQIAKIPTGGREFKDETKQRRYRSASEAYVVMQSKIRDLELELSEIEGALELEIPSENFNIDQLTTTDPNTHNIPAMIEQMDKLDTFMESLGKSGRKQDAAMLKELVEEYKANSDAHREMNNMMRRMMDTNFFSTKEGKGLTRMILGKRYEMTDDFRKILKDNDEVIDKALKQTKIRGTKAIEDRMKEILEDNEELSDREKYRLESIIRLQLGYQKLGTRLAEIQDSTIIPDTETATSNNPLVGDTIRISERLNPEGKDLGNIEVLTKLIKQITDELDSFRKQRINTEAKTKLEKELEELNKLKEERSKGALSQEEVTLLESLKKDLEAEEKLEEKSEEIVEKLTTQIASLENRILSKEDVSKTDARIEAIEDELENFEEEKEIKLLKSDDYKRLYELTRKQEQEFLTEEEQVEMEELATDIDQWIELTGTVVEGLRLSDLIRQKIILEETPILPLENVGGVTSQEVINSVDIGDKSGSVYFEIMQSYDGVMVVRNKDGKIEISGITPESMLQKVGVPFEYTTNKQGNILIEDEVREFINNNSPVSILPFTENLTTNYSVVLEEQLGMDGAMEQYYMKTDYKKDFNKKEMDTEAIYSLRAATESESGEAIKLQVDFKDDYNVGLANKYKRAKSDKGRTKALTELKEGFVLRILKSDGTFIAVGKSKREGGNRSLEDLKYEALRDQIVETPEFIDRLENDSIFDPNIEGITVKKVYLGHPNLNYVKNEEGNMAIEHKSLTDQDIQKVDDIGYATEGNIKTQSGIMGVNTTFLKTSMEKNPAAKIPFVIFTKGNQRIAYPVKVQPIDKAGTDEFTNIFRGNLSMADKADNLNKFMAARGIDIKIPGDSFITVHKTNLTETFFSQKLAQLESIEYFSELESWADKKVDKAQTLKSGVSIDLKLADPLHSPKVQLDFSGLDVKISTENISTSTGRETSTKGVDNMMNDLKEDC